MRPPVRKCDAFTDLHPKLMVPSGGGFIASAFVLQDMAADFVSNLCDRRRFCGSRPSARISGCPAATNLRL